MSSSRGTLLLWSLIPIVTVAVQMIEIALMVRTRRRLLQDERERERVIRFGHDKVNDRVLDRLRRSDPTLKNLHITFLGAGAEGSDERDRFLQQYIIPAIDTIGDCTLHEMADRSEMEDCFPRVKRLIDLHRNTRNNNSDAVKRNQNLEMLTIFGLSCAEGHYIRMRLQVPMEMSSCTVHVHGSIFGNSVAPFLEYTFQRKRATATATAAATYSITFGNQIPREEAVASIESLALDGPYQIFIFQGRYLRGRNPAHSLLSLRMMKDDSAVRIIRALCRLPAARVIMFKGANLISASGGASIIKILEETNHNLTKLELFDDDQVSTWQIAIRIGIDQQTWVKHFLGLDAGTQERLFLLALKRSEASDIGRGSLQRLLFLPARSRGPDMLFYLVKKKADLIQHAKRFY